MDKSEQIITRYLLGELSESEQSALEDKYFTDPQVFDQVLKTESELVDSYVRGQLPNKVRERFEQSYKAHPARRKRVTFAAALVSRLDQIEDSVNQQGAADLARLLVEEVTGVAERPEAEVEILNRARDFAGHAGRRLGFIDSQRRQQRELAQTQAASEAELRRERELSQQAADENRRAAEALAADRNRAERSPQQISQPSPTPTLSSAPRSVSLALTVGGVRGGDKSQIPTLVIPPGTAQARLQLNLKENDYPTYRASLQTVAGVEIFSQTSVKPVRAKTGASFVFTVPARKLAAGDYILTLRGVTPDGEVDDLSKSLFRVEKR